MPGQYQKYPQFVRFSALMPTKKLAPDMNAEEARAFFPRGLFQPRGSFRFSLDALLLASFLTPARQGRGQRLLDLGAGCGVVALGMLCRYPRLEAVALDIQPELAEAAGINAARLGFADRFTSLCRDVTDPELPAGREGAFNLVLANPPYRRRASGRLPASRMRALALFEAEGGLTAFCRAAERAMAPDGRFGVVFPAKRLEELQSALHDAALTPVRPLLVRARAAGPVMLTLIEAVKSASLCRRMRSGREGACESVGPAPDTSLALHEVRGANTVFTKQALDFCPFLVCNAGTKGYCPQY